ncbi:leucine--tRNA ligase [Candidatus Cytomitobacter indipagum]|uniref:leucine--tRNA ligase n=1 Tax=Candidatus Cytomitobacter indipagum TaxID=2601575 RepID=A0A5C0UDW9_9PROT|nr:class I tRNA ligase family protein [Candidatus Cytomitobacter indipagum]QEK37959.1 leucine--tRNA ligase [Candidatus Cytomitobacter indipagum]
MNQIQIDQMEQSIKKLWKESNLYKSEISSKPSYCILDFFPYPSGIGLHVGHTIGYISTDIFARFKRMQGNNVLYAMGFDSFGLPAEQFAIQTNQHPEITTQTNIKNMKAQLEALSLSHDTDKSFSTTDPKYYKWTQWIFTKLYNSYFNNIEKKAENIEELRKKLKSKTFSVEDGELIEKSNNYSQKEISQLINEMRLAYLDDIEVNWCPMLGTVLANEEVKDGKSEQGNHPVEKRPMKQWILRITKYADRLHDQLDQLNWPSNIITMQKNWIGRNEGVKVYFDSKYGKIEIFTTRPETVFGVTFIGISHNHPILQKAGIKSDKEQKIGYAIHPLTQKEIPIWTTDYVIQEYGTGAVMSVPAHDQRDYEFAKKHNIEFKSVIKAPYLWLKENKSECISDSKLLDEWKENPCKFKSAFENKAPLFAPQQFEIHEDMSVKNQIKQVIQFLEENKVGKKTTNYRLRDWLFSRQRYWGEPFPIVFDESGNAYSIHESCLPITLPKQYDFKPALNQENAEPPLAKAKEWKSVRGIVMDDGSVKTLSDSDPKNPDEQIFKRELNTMPNWAGSCWYYLRYMDPHNDSSIASQEALKYWSCNDIGSVDMYVGGAEHAVLHLLYARFWHMVLFDLGHVPNPEPFNKLVNPGMMTADAYSNSRGFYIDIEDVELKNKSAFQISTGEELNIEPGKMGKRYKNGLDPRKACDKYGIDIFRMHVMYMAPITQSRSWDVSNIKGMERFYRSIHAKIAKCIQNSEKSTDNPTKLHQTIKFITEEMSNMRYNTSIAALIKLNNDAEKFSLDDSVKVLQMLYPFAPHLSEHLYQEIKLINNIEHNCIEQIEWPQYDPNLLQDDTTKLPININGKIRDVLEVSVDIVDEEIKNLISKSEKAAKYISSDIKKYIIIRKNNKPIIVNIVC